MITGLTEGNKKKADQYWPDEDNRTMDLENGMKVEHKEKSYQGTYFLRYLLLLCDYLTKVLQNYEGAGYSWFPPHSDPAADHQVAGPDCS